VALARWIVAVVAVEQMRPKGLELVALQLAWSQVGELASRWLALVVVDVASQWLALVVVDVASQWLALVGEAFPW
jgi:hypothetical protein